MDCIADEEHPPNSSNNWQQSTSSLIGKGFRKSVKVVEKGVNHGIHQGKKTIERGVRKATKFIQKKASVASGGAEESNTGNTTNSNNSNNVNAVKDENEKASSIAQPAAGLCGIINNGDSLIDNRQDLIPPDPKENESCYLTERDSENQAAADCIAEKEQIPPTLVATTTGEINNNKTTSSSSFACLVANVATAKEDEKAEIPVKMSNAPTDEEPGSAMYFEKWIQNLERVLVVPDLDEELWVATLQGYQRSNDALIKAQKELDEANKKQPNPGPNVINSLQKAVSQAQQEVNESLAHGQTVAASILQTPELASFLDPTSTSDNTSVDDDWVTWRVLKSAAPKQWADWCRQPQEMYQCQANEAATWQQQPTPMLDRLVGMLHATEFLRQVLQEGGPRGNQYCEFLRLYQTIGPDQDSAVLQRLAWAVALEYAANDYTVFGTKDKIDPLQRYIHYEQAYLGGELDPAFGSLRVWELRMAINSDAPEDQLSWGRRSLINYRPDLVLSDNDQWRYNFIVKSDVPYATPDWYKGSPSYDQILSGGGKCGPRAWYGRFICKAFGNPTWGTRQKGHASMSRWTPKGWVMCLGANWPFCFWEGKTGIDFKLESDARRACSSSREYRQLVQRLQWVAMFKKESTKTVRDKSEPSPLCPWTSLEMYQNKILATSGSAQSILGDASNHTGKINREEKVTSEIPEKVVSKIQRMKEHGPPTPGSPDYDPATGTLVLPSDCCSSPQSSNNKVSFFPNFDGGRQIFLKADGVIEYTLGPPFVMPRVPTLYKLSVCVCTVHRAETDMLVTVTEGGGGGSPTKYTLSLPYTTGEWQYTVPVTIELSGKLNTKLSFQRMYHNFGISLKELKLSIA